MDKERLFAYKNWSSLTCIVFHLRLRHALLIQQSCNSNICSDSLTYSRKKAITNVLKCSFNKCSDWHQLHSSEKYGGVCGISLGNTSWSSTAAERSGHFCLRDKERDKQSPYALFLRFLRELSRSSWCVPKAGGWLQLSCHSKLLSLWTTEEWTERFCHCRTVKGYAYAHVWSQQGAQSHSPVCEVDLSGICEGPNSFHLSTAQQSRSAHATPWQRSAKGTLAGQRALCLSRTVNRMDNARDQLVQKGLRSSLVPGTFVPCVSIPCHWSWNCQQLWEAVSH